MASAGKTVRFAQIVERSGQPRPHTLWVAPAKDPELQRAIATDRVMTVETGGRAGKTDVGVVGFHEHANGQLLIFPKSLKRFAGARVVGIKFDLVEHPSFADAAALRNAATAPRPGHRKKTSAPPVPVRVDVAPAAETEEHDIGSVEPSPQRPRHSGPAPKTRRTPAEDHAPRSAHARSSSTRRTSDEPTPAVTTRSAPKATPPRAAASSGPTRRAPADPQLLRAVRAALKELEAGKAVAAFQRLQRAVAAAES